MTDVFTAKKKGKKNLSAMKASLEDDMMPLPKKKKKFDALSARAK